MTAARFLRYFFVTVATAAALIGAFNYAIDPFDLWVMPRIAGINSVKSIGNFRFVKPLQVEVRRPETVILGSSRSVYGFDRRDFPQPDRTYDFGIPALTATEMRGYGLHILWNTPVRKLIIELGFFEFNGRQSPTPDYAGAKLGRSALLRAFPIVLFSEEALLRSGNSIMDSHEGTGRFNLTEGFGVFPFDPSADPIPEFMKVVEEFAHSDQLYGKYSRFDRPMAEYRALLAAVKAKGVDMVTFIAPEHASMLVAIERNGLWPLYQSWERGLVQVSSDAGVPLWDFSGYNAYTVTPLADGYRTHYKASHFRPWVGRLILARMNGAAEPADFGVLLTPDMIDHHLADLEAGRVAYRRDHAEDVACVEAAVGRQPMSVENNRRDATSTP